MAKSKHPLYQTWINMIRRCYSPSRGHYKYYGGRGIQVCDEWKEDFFAFVEDMGPRPEGYTLDRIDNNSHYSPDNCKWSSKKEQAANRRTRIDAAKHGTNSKYVGGCRCVSCTKAHSTATRRSYHNRKNN